MLSAVLLTVPLPAVSPPAHATPPAHAVTVAVPAAAPAPATRTDPPALTPVSVPASVPGPAPGPPPHLADTGSPGVTRIGAAALVFLSAGALLVAAARRLRRR
ncbi:hypothetical protein [Streptomyces sp. Ac-502]|uniref:hypothetical protein n=1 Tax=Streptomyces sp. Ac-502 TaxID=3342801 RepID=UPI003862AFB7